MDLIVDFSEPLFSLTPQHSRELSAVKAVIESHHQELQELHTFLVGPEQGDRRQLDHSGLVREMKREIVKLKSQVCVCVHLSRVFVL